MAVSEVSGFYRIGSFRSQETQHGLVASVQQSSKGALRFFFFSMENLPYRPYPQDGKCRRLKGSQWWLYLTHHPLKGSGISLLKPRGSHRECGAKPACVTLSFPWLKLGGVWSLGLGQGNEVQGWDFGESWEQQTWRKRVGFPCVRQDVCKLNIWFKHC